MPYVTLADLAALLAALALAPVLARWLGIGTVLGYLVAGIALGPYALGVVFSDYKAKEFLHFAEFGVVLLLFLIGLELKPMRLWAMRTSIFGLGGAQLVLSALALAVITLVLGEAWQTALFIGLALALSSTAFALQVLEETGELRARHGRLAFAVLLFQDLAAIPLIALAPLFAIASKTSAPGMDLAAAGKALATIAGVVLIGYFVLDRLFRLVAATRVKEAMTAAALLTVVVVTIGMQQAGLSASLGAFVAGALLAESSYRHQLEADIQPFQGLLLGLFFTAVGMSLNLGLVEEHWIEIGAFVAGLVAIKALVLYGLGRWYGLERRPSRRLGLALSQGGEFAFLLFGAGLSGGVLDATTGEVLFVVVTLSMAATPLLLTVEQWLAGLATPALAAYDQLPVAEDHVIIAGFGRFGQIVARVLRAKGIAFTALDINAEQVELVKGFGAKAFYGDASRPEILAAAQAEKARALVLAIDDVEASMRTAAFVKSAYPELPIYARARNRNHALRLLDLGITTFERETFLSALEITRQVLIGLGTPHKEAERLVAVFEAHDERRLKSDYKFYSDVEKLQAKARTDTETLAQLFAEDAAERAAADNKASVEAGKRKETAA
ncbi:MAG: cation:proton antiporter [Pseudomonadota bacterium]